MLIFLYLFFHIFLFVHCVSSVAQQFAICMLCLAMVDYDVIQDMIIV